MRLSSLRSAAAGVAVLTLGAACSGAAETIVAGDGVDQSKSPTPDQTQPTESSQSTRSPTSTRPTAPVDPQPRHVPGDYSAGESTPIEDPYYPDKSNPEVDSLHYDLTLGWDGSTLTGTTILDFRAAKATKTVRLDLADEMHVGGVSLDAKAINFTRDEDGLIMQTGPLRRDSEHWVRIDYSGAPALTPAPSQRGDMTEGLGWSVAPDGGAYTFQEPYGAFTWYPVNDHPSDKALYDATITAPGRWSAVFNGVLEDKQVNDDSTTSQWHLDEPAASYLITIAIGPYKEVKGPRSGDLAISYWVRPQDAALVPDMAREGKAAYDWLVANAGPYPFSSLGVVVVGGASAMETQTMITVSAGAMDRPDAVLQHEIAHAWYGDSVTTDNWRDLWLNEGFAMYMQAWYEREMGRQAFGGGIDQWRTIDQGLRDEAGPPGQPDQDSFASGNVYIPPALMLDEIRKRVGDKKFEAAIKAWPAEHENTSQDRAAFTRWINAETGTDLTAMINAWLDSPTTPR